MHEKSFHYSSTGHTRAKDLPDIGLCKEEGFAVRTPGKIRPMPRWQSESSWHHDAADSDSEQMKERSAMGVCKMKHLAREALVRDSAS